MTPGNIHDSVPYLERLDRQAKRFNFKVEAVALDAGYLTTAICHGLTERSIFGVIAHRRYKSAHGFMPKWKFRYDEETDTYTCPNSQTLTYSTTTEKVIGIISQTLQTVPFARS